MSDTESSERTGLAFWAPLIAASLALFVVVVDSNMMNVAVPTIVNDLNTSVSAVQGVTSLYSLGTVGLLLIMFLLSTFLPRRKERDIPPAERVPDVAEEVVA